MSLVVLSSIISFWYSDNYQITTASSSNVYSRDIFPWDCIIQQNNNHYFDVYDSSNNKIYEIQWMNMRLQCFWFTWYVLSVDWNSHTLNYYHIPLSNLYSLLTSCSQWFYNMTVNLYNSSNQLVDYVSSDTYDNDSFINLYMNDWVSYSLVDNRPDWLNYYFNNSINTWDLLSWYILESSIDSNYCELNNLCPVYTWDSEDLSWVNRSILHINWIEHVWAWFIDITIPEEFDWNYLYTWNWDVFELNISWYNVDTEYIDWIITTQKTLPNKEDFNNTISWLLPWFVPWLVIVLFLYFVFRFLKKVF